MKSIISIFVLLVFSVQLNAQKKYLITGKIKIDTVRGEVSLSAFDPITQTKTQIAKEIISPDGSFHLEYSFIQPDLFRLDLPDRHALYMAIDRGQNKIQVVLDQKEAYRVQGSPDTKKLMAYDAFRRVSNDKWIRPTYRAMREATKSGDQEGEIAAVEEYVKNSKIHRQELINFTEQEIGTSIALYGTALRWTGDDEINRLEKLVNAFAQKHPHLPMTEQMLNKVQRYRKVAIGSQAADIIARDLQGASIQLYDHLGKYTLIDFWASWCRPCILQIPDLQKVYTAFNHQGFEIFSYSVDRNEEKWLDAAKKYEMPWVHASDIKGWESPVAADYNVTFVPFNLLLDQDGKIIAKNLHHKTLYNYLTELFQGVE